MQIIINPASMEISFMLLKVSLVTHPILHQLQSNIFHQPRFHKQHLLHLINEYLNHMMLIRAVYHLEPPVKAQLGQVAPLVTPVDQAVAAAPLATEVATAAVEASDRRSGVRFT